MLATNGRWCIVGFCTLRDTAQVDDSEPDVPRYIWHFFGYPEPDRVTHWAELPPLPVSDLSSTG